MQALVATRSLPAPMTQLTYNASRWRRLLNAIRSGGFLGQVEPRWLLMLSFGLAIALGTLLLKLPFATTRGNSTSWLDALFSATSATCVTGLVVVDTGTHFSLFGQLVILMLIQIGGLGIMTLATCLLLMLGRRLTLRDRAVLRESLTQVPFGNFGDLLRTIIRFTLYVEGVGALLLFVRFLVYFTTELHLPAAAAVPKALYFGVFHAVSAFCNAGFSPFSRNLMDFRGDLMINTVFGGLIIVGGLGFLTVRDVTQRLLGAPERPAKKPRLMLHSRVVLLTTVALIFGGALLLYVFELKHTGRGASAGVRAISALFLSVTSRTAGYNTVDTALLADATKLIVIFLMFVGASPGSCGGGVKTSTLAVAWALIVSRLRGREQAQIGRRTIPNETVIKALGVITACFFLVVGVALALTLTEDQPGRAVPKFIDLLFEATSAFGTVGLSANVTPTLCGWSKLLLIFTMYAGRVGPLTLIMAFSTRTTAPKFKYPEETVMIG